MEPVIYILVAVVIASAIAYLFYNLQKRKLAEQNLKLIEEEKVKYSELEKLNLVSSERNDYLTKQLNETQKTNLQKQEENDQLRSEVTKLKVESEHLQKKNEDVLKEFEKLQKQATTEFENIANKILKKNTIEFSNVNNEKLKEILSPLKEKILTFEKKVEDTYEKGLKDQTDLRAELKKLQDLNYKISEEATNLTKALKGDVKKQGNWGEIVLERILERSGLTEGQEFQREVVAKNVEGKIIRPDVIVNLPDKKHIIIDSKVSLIAYERYTNSEEQVERDRFLKEHLLSLKNHIKELHEKHYNSSPNFNSPDFVLLFIPIESSFSVAVEHDQQIFNYAWENKIVIVSPSTLLATLRTIASIWQQENQTKNALEIAKQSGALYDKFASFIEDVDKLGRNIETIQKTYTEASKKLYTGKGNLVRRAEVLRELGAAASKQIPDKFLD